ncbi:hydroxymethylpyrimidine/phosphomethylpyrimidine kinase [Aequorivita xiaoshiensis]|uniref:hydroxymethylpyrimidine kinase n=1 Tax=Aequorivita xiaoshiensis TaxID=2874476 RepID=A0A9X1U742_9FLAO|nr:hydroxymethylpyrimidine/phosphomethylpyrimidine kinase [Aequorivita xiaoshiensis]MCG2431832.1 hydroxymethylpyrimidine/phosphomethylpyrimidine kinase [Aequorivita xiaoshiensis]
MNNHKYILSIAGHDPSGGAGITSDIKTFEAHGLYGLSVCTAITIQHDSDFKHCVWVDTEIILAQIAVLFERFPMDTVKIGLVKSWQSLLRILEKLHRINPSIKVVLDPIFKASAGFDFHSDEDQNNLDKILKHCYIITPNYDEMLSLYPNIDFEETLLHMKKFTNIYLKGGHRLDKKGWDELHPTSQQPYQIPPIAASISEKHGSGCVLSSSLASNIRLGQDLQTACDKAKRYTEQFLNSHPSLLGVHHKNVII